MPEWWDILIQVGRGKMNFPTGRESGEWSELGIDLNLKGWRVGGGEILSHLKRKHNVAFHFFNIVWLQDWNSSRIQGEEGWWVNVFVGLLIQPLGPTSATHFRMVVNLLLLLSEVCRHSLAWYVVGNQTFEMFCAIRMKLWKTQVGNSVKLWTEWLALQGLMHVAFQSNFLSYNAWGLGESKSSLNQFGAQKKLPD